jgi:acyl-CoA thioester hydrolase
MRRSLVIMLTILDLPSKLAIRFIFHHILCMDSSKPYEGFLTSGEHHFAVRVYYEDTDVGGVVYHANYLRFMERARSDLLRVLGIDQRAAFEQGIGIYAVTEVQIQYRKPAKFDDALLIVTRLETLRHASCALTQQILRNGELLAQAKVVIAFLSPEGRPRKQPDEWVQKFQSLNPPQ